MTGIGLDSFFQTLDNTNSHTVDLQHLPLGFTLPIHTGFMPFIPLYSFVLPAKVWRPILALKQGHIPYRILNFSFSDASFVKLSSLLSQGFRVNLAEFKRPAAVTVLVL